MQSINSLRPWVPNSHTGARSIAVPLLLFVCAGCGDHHTQLLYESSAKSPAPVAMHVNVLQPELADNATESVVCFGRIKPTRDALLSFAKGGVVVDVRKQAGDSVVEGELLANLDQEKIIQQQRDAEIALRRVQEAARRATQAEADRLIPQMQTLKGQLNALKTELVKGQLNAPFTGIVAECNVESGASVSPQMTAFVIVEEGSPLVEVNLTAEKASQLPDDEQLWIGHNGLARRARIKQRSPIHEPTDGVKLLLEFEKPLETDQWIYGTVVEIRYRTATDVSGYWLPISALHRTHDGPWSVLVAEQSPNNDAGQLIVVRRECQVVRYEDDRVLVSEFDKGTAFVIVDGGHRVVPGQTVTVVEPASLDAERQPKGEL